MKNNFGPILTVLFILQIAGCGGGGSDDSPPGNSNGNGNGGGNSVDGSMLLPPSNIQPMNLNDTGLTFCADSDGSQFPVVGSNCPVQGLTGQDADHGRDAIGVIKIGDGKAGFDFTKLDSSGQQLAASATNWSCTKDNNTGLTWEVKKTDSGIHDGNNTYSWYNPDSSTNGGWSNAEDRNEGDCSESDCDTYSFIKAVNERGLCGSNQWRLPTRTELLSLIDHSIAKGQSSGSSTSNTWTAIDINYFPNTKINVNGGYWTASPCLRTQGHWGIEFDTGLINCGALNGFSPVRLVRSGQ